VKKKTRDKILTTIPIVFISIMLIFLFCLEPNIVEIAKMPTVEQCIENIKNEICTSKYDNPDSIYISNSEYVGYICKDDGDIYVTAYITVIWENKDQNIVLDKYIVLFGGVPHYEFTNLSTSSTILGVNVQNYYVDEITLIESSNLSAIDAACDD